MNQKVTELKGEIEKYTTMIGDFNMPLSITEKCINRRSVNQFDLFNIYRTLHPRTVNENYTQELQNVHKNRPYTGT